MLAWERTDRTPVPHRPDGDGPVPRDPEAVMLYERLVLLALAEASLATLERQASLGKGKTKKK